MDSHAKKGNAPLLDYKPRRRGRRKSFRRETDSLETLSDSELAKKERSRSGWLGEDTTPFFDYDLPSVRARHALEIKPVCSLAKKEMSRSRRSYEDTTDSSDYDDDNLSSVRTHHAATETKVCSGDKAEAVSSTEKRTLKRLRKLMRVKMG